MPAMALLVVDERDGRIVAEVQTVAEAQALLEAWARDDGSVAEEFSLVELKSHHGAIIGSDASVRVRPLR
jgi:hypothetical protein